MTRERGSVSAKLSVAIAAVLAVGLVWCWGAISQGSNSGIATNTKKSFTITLAPGAPAAGNVMIVAVGAASATSATVTQTNVSYGAGAVVTGSSSGATCAIWVGSVSASASTTITIGTYGSNTTAEAAAYDWTGLTTTTDGTKSATNTGTSGAPTSMTTTNANDLIYAQVTEASVTLTTRPSGYTNLDTLLPGTLTGDDEFKILTGTSAENPTWTFPSAAWAACSVALKATASGTSFPRTAADTTLSAESLVRALALFRAPANTALSAETVARKLAGLRAPANQGTLSAETVGRVRDVPRPAADTTLSAETLARAAIVFGRAPGTVATLSTETAARNAIAFGRAPGGVAGLSAESPIRLVGMARGSTDGTLSEVTARKLASARAAADTASVGESIAQQFGVARFLSDSAAVSSSAERAAIAFVRTDATTAVSAEAAVRSAISFARTTGAIAGLAGVSLVRAAALARGDAATAFVGETAGRKTGFGRAASDAAAVNEAAVRAAIAFARASADAAGGSVSVVVSLQGSGVTSRTVSTNVAVSPAVLITVGAYRGAANDLTASVAVTRGLAVVRDAAEAGFVSASVQNARVFGRSLATSALVEGVAMRARGTLRDASASIAAATLVSGQRAVWAPVVAANRAFLLGARPGLFALPARVSAFGFEFVRLTGFSYPGGVTVFVLLPRVSAFRF